MLNTLRFVIDKNLCLFIIIIVICCKSNAQCLTNKQVWDDIISVEDSPKSFDEKIAELTLLKNKFDHCDLEKDSVYARLLHRIGALYYQEHNYNDAIGYINRALEINKSPKAGACKWFIANSYYNLFLCYANLGMNNKVIAYSDSVIEENKKFPQSDRLIPSLRWQRGNIFYKRGDFQQDVEETTLGLQKARAIKDTSTIISLLLERAEAYEAQSKIEEGLTDVNYALQLLEKHRMDDNNIQANAYRYKAALLAGKEQFSDAIKLFDEAIEYRIKAGNMEQVAIDYNDAGDMLLYTGKDSREAEKYFIKCRQVAIESGNKLALAYAYNNFSQLNFIDRNYLQALTNCQLGLKALLSHYDVKNFKINPSYKELINLESNYALNILEQKSQCLLYLFKQKKDTSFLKAVIKTALLSDSLLTNLRHEQVAEQTKLYWRVNTRDFFTNILEACYLNNDPKLAFYFMEKSRAVLLNDKLNELGASLHLPAEDNKKLAEFLDEITSKQQKLTELEDASQQYLLQQNSLLQTKENFEHYIKSLEKKYPAYYQYKYADAVDSLQSLQQYLAKNNQSFVHYFLGDTVTYILAITPDHAKLIRLSEKEFNKKELVDFLQFCANKQTLNNHYNSFARLSNSIYKSLFQHLQLPTGRITICTDNIVIPFDALCTDETGKHFLLNNYSFNYVYSARFLMKQFINTTAKGNFIGFAPVSFNKSLGIVDLKNADDALHASASYYKKDKLFIHQNASRNNFFTYAPSYSIVSIFSHAFADTTDNEPVLFMQDSAIHLSELQYLNDPATQLVLLSACQTNVGKAATGEGIYSLARGFAAAGIPSVVATLWKADEQTIYAISEKFNEYLSEGMNKDEALQKAKLYFIQNNNSEKILPYYWANMILIGNTDAISLVTKGNNYLWWLAGFLLIAGIIILTRKKILLPQK